MQGEGCVWFFQEGVVGPTDIAATIKKEIKESHGWLMKGKK